MTDAPAYSIRPARYAKGKKAVTTYGRDGYKVRACRLAEAIARGRYTDRENAYIMSPAAAKRFERLYAEGWDASVMTYALEHPPSETASYYAERDIVKIDKALDALRAMVRRRETFGELDFEAWGHAWCRNPVLKKAQDALYLRRGEAQLVRDHVPTPGRR